MKLIWLRDGKRKKSSQRESHNLKMQKNLKTSTEITQMFLTKSFNTPPSQEDKVKNNRINVVDNIFPSKMMIPKGLQSEKCDFGNTFDCKEFESTL